MPRKSLHSSINNLSYKSLLIILFFLLINIVVLWKFVLPNHKVEASWWNDGWNYRKAVSIGNSGTTTTNQYVKITLDTSSLITAGKMKNTCDDIRVTNINGKLLTHFVDGNASFACNTSTTSIYVLIDSIPSSGSTIYVYYGNPSAVNVEPILGTQQNPAISCKNILQHRSDNKGTQQYYIIPTGNMANSIQVTCDMTYSSGGWIQVWHGLPSEAFVNDATHESINLSNNIIFNEMRVEGTNLNFNVIDTVTQTAMLGSSIRTYFNQVHNAPDTPSPKVAFHNLSGTQSINLTNNYFMYGYGNVYRFFYTCIDVSGINDYYTGGGTPTCTPRSSFNPTSVGCASVNYCSNVRNTTPIDSGLHLSLYQYQESSVYVRENTITLNISQSMGTIAAEEAGGGPIAYWKFDEGSGTTAYDSSSNQNNGTFGTGNSAPTWANESQCIAGKCLKFDGSNDYINAGTNPSLNFGTNSFSVFTWVKFNSNTANQYFINGRTVGSSRWHLYVNSSNVLSFWIADSGGTVANSTIGSYNANQWYYLGFVRDKSAGKVYFYKDGKLITSANDSTNNITSQGVYLGAFDGSGSWFNGFLDEPKIYPYARTADQIKQDYNSRGSSSGSGVNMGSSNGGINLSDGLVGYWKMDEGVGTTTADSSGNSGTGTLTNTGWTNGKFGIGTSFGGTSNYIGIGKTLIPTGNFSVSGWFYPTDGTGYHSIAGQYSSGQTGRLWVGLENSTFGYRIGDNNQTVAIDLNQWIFGTITREGSQVKIYINGELKNTSTASDNIYQTNTYIGSYDSTGGFFAGTLDEVRIYNRTLSPAEVSALYNYAPGPVGYWDFEENTGSTIKDKSGNNYSGTSYNTSYVSGKIGSALKFIGNTSSYISLNYQAINNLRDFTTSFWMKSSGSGDGIISGAGSSSSNELFIAYQDNFNIRTRDVNVTTNTSTNDNQWHYISVTRNQSTGNMAIYVDGILKNQGISGTDPLNISSSGFIVGQDQDSIGGGFQDTQAYDGLLDELKIYNYIRTQKQIIEDMNGSRPAASAKSPIGYWKFDESSGTTANNSGNGGSALNGTFGTGSSAPTWINESKSGKGLSFDGTNDYISIPDTNNILDMSNVTITGWLYKTTNASDHHTILSRNGESFFINFYNNTFESYFFTSGGICYNSGTSYLPYLNGWHYFATSYDGQNSKLYLDSKLIKTVSTCSGSINSSNQNLFIGSRTATSAFLNSKIDELKIYNYALTDEEIKQDYNQNSAMQMGQTSQTIGGTTTSLEYCIPGDTSYCTSPVGEWNFEENTGTTAKDTSGNNNNGTISGATWTTGANNKGAALNFNGSSDYVSIPDSSASLSSNFTVSFWVKPNDDSNNPRWFSLIDGSNNLQIGHMGTDEKVYFRFADSAIETITGITLNQWTFVTCKMESGTRKIFFNGIEQTTESGGITSNATYSAIGGGFPNYTTNGKIDNVKIYNYARTPAQIAYDYNKGAPVGWWKFDECQGGTAYDSSGVGNTGVIVIGSSGTQNSLGTCQIGTSAAWTNGASGKINSSLNFDGTDDYVNLNNNYANIYTKFSLSAWIKLRNGVPNQGAFFGNYSSYLGTYLSRGTSDSRFRVCEGGTSCKDITVSTSYTPLNSWVHLLGTYDGSTSKFYINGILRGQLTGVNVAVWSNNFTIGKQSWSEHYTDGQIDDVRIYNYALTPEQVKQIYNGGAVSFN